jgi:hypothetical protein
MLEYLVRMYVCRPNLIRYEREFASQLLLGDPGMRRGNEPGHDQGSKADECDCDHFSAPSAEARNLGPSMFEVYAESRLESVAQRWYMGGALVARRLRLGTMLDHKLAYWRATRARLGARAAG